MTDAIDSPPLAITFDNIHLSQPILRSSEAGDDGRPGGKLVVETLEPAIRELIEATTAPNTRRAYQNDLRQFLAWGGSVQARPEIVAAYLAAHAKTLSVATLARRVVAIHMAHALAGLPDPTKSELIRLALRGVRRLYGHPQRRVAPLRVEHLSAIVSVLGGSTRDLRDRALLLNGFAGAFRRSELSAVNCNWIEWTEQGVVLTLPKSKTDQEGRGRNIAIPRVGGPICPVAALDAWLEASGIVDGPLFRPVSKAGIRRIFRDSGGRRRSKIVLAHLGGEPLATSLR